VRPILMANGDPRSNPLVTPSYKGKNLAVDSTINGWARRPAVKQKKKAL